MSLLFETQNTLTLCILYIFCRGASDGEDSKPVLEPQSDSHWKGQGRTAKSVDHLSREVRGHLRDRGQVSDDVYKQLL